MEKHLPKSLARYQKVINEGNHSNEKYGVKSKTGSKKCWNSMISTYAIKDQVLRDTNINLEDSIRSSAADATYLQNNYYVTEIAGDECNYLDEEEDIGKKKTQANQLPRRKLSEAALRGVLRKRCSENMQQIYRTTPMLKCGFRVALRHGCSPVN